MKRRRLQFEQLEHRRPLAWAGPDPDAFFDVWPVSEDGQTWGDGQVTPGDVNSIITDINLNGGPRNVGGNHRTDVNFDFHLTSADVLCLINHLNQPPPPPPQVDFRVCIHSNSSTGFTDSEIRQAMEDGFGKFTEAFGTVFAYVDSRCDVNVRTAEIYVGGGVHGSGSFQRPNNITLSNGTAGPFRHSGGLGPRNEWVSFQLFANLEVAATIVAHEFGHMLGLDHISDRNCVMHAGAVSHTFCPQEFAFFEFVLGGGSAGPAEDHIDVLYEP